MTPRNPFLQQGQSPSGYGTPASKTHIDALEACATLNDDFLFITKLVKSLNALSDEIYEVKQLLHTMQQSPTEAFSQQWFDGQQVMQTLKISPRTLQTLRDKGILPFSRISGKFYYQVSDLEALLQRSYSGKIKEVGHGAK